MGVVREGPVAAFCAELRQRWRASGRDLSGVARELRISRAQLYAILNGEIKRPPDFDTLVGPLIRACRGTEPELADWRRRHEVLTAVHTELRRRTKPAPSAPPSAPAPAPAQLPADVEGFAGRAAALADLHATTARVVTITGLAGVGKTALAVHWAHRVAADFPDGQLYVDLRGFDPGRETVDPAEAVRGFLDALGVDPDRIPQGRDAQAALYRSRLSGRRVLVVLDNAFDADQVRPLLAGAPAVRTIVTSRHRLAELVAEVGAHPLSLEPPDRTEAIELLRRRIGGAGWDAEAGAAVVAACGHHPLALALVAARIRHTGFSPATLALELGRPHPDVLGGVRAVFSWSYRALSPAAARLFRLLGLTGGADISATAATALLAAAPADGERRLRELTDASLLTEHLPGRYRMHDLLRRYARDLARETEPDDERRASLTRLLDHYTHTAYEAELVLNPTRPPVPALVRGSAEDAGQKSRFDVKAALEWLNTERAVLMSSLRQAKDEGMDRHAWQLTWALDTVLNDQRRWQEEDAAWAVALRAATGLADRPAAAYAHRFLAVTAGRLERFDDAYTHLHDATRLCREAGDRAGEAETLYVLSYVCWLQADLDRALEHARRSMELWRELDHPGWEGKACNAVGWYLAGRGEPVQALEHHERALMLHRRTGNAASEALGLDVLGRAHHDLGRYEAAIDLYERGLRKARDITDPIIEAGLLAHLGDTCQAVGDDTGAREHWQAACTLLTDIGHAGAADVRRRLAD
ncbi:tetratricopeptide repeat protein [Actinoplanes sp. NPDC023801]|uniref:ATP-binding protein n=1 Tax=Actinoplanes sp. NPDC023801 TaxID=3154595 RepID=UPI00340525C0